MENIILNKQLYDLLDKYSYITQYNDNGEYYLNENFVIDFTQYVTEKDGGNNSTIETENQQVLDSFYYIRYSLFANELQNPTRFGKYILTIQ